MKVGHVIDVLFFNFASAGNPSRICAVFRAVKSLYIEVNRLSLSMEVYKRLKNIRVTRKSTQPEMELLLILLLLCLSVEFLLECVKHVRFVYIFIYFFLSMYVRRAGMYAREYKVSFALRSLGNVYESIRLTSLEM